MLFLSSIGHQELTINYYLNIDKLKFRKRQIEADRNFFVSGFNGIWHVYPSGQNYKSHQNFVSLALCDLTVKHFKGQDKF